MSLEDKAVLGISLGTRVLGIAVVKGDKLLLWKVKKFRNGAWSKDRTKHIVTFIASYIRAHEIHAIAVKVPTVGNLSNGLIDLISSLGVYASISNLNMQAFRISDLKQCFVKASLNRNEMMHSVCQRFPFLEVAYRKELANKKAYHVKMFEAILSAICLQKRHRNAHRRRQ